MIKVVDATKIYRMGAEEIRALDGISLDIEKGEFVALLGPSGSGKSTLMNVIGALDVLDSGEIHVNGDDVSKLRDKPQAKYRRENIGFVFQTFNLMNHLTALENVEMPLTFSGVGRKQRREMALEALDKVDLSARIKHKPTELSGGQQQRVAIARAIVNKPKILLADEPTGNVDSVTGERIMELIKELNKEDKVTVIMVTHNEEHSGFADRVVRMRDGKFFAGDLEAEDIKKADLSDGI